MVIRYCQDGVDRTLTFSMWDFGGHRIFDELHHLYMTRFGAYVSCFDMAWLVSDDAATVARALADLKFWLGAIKIHADGAPIVLVGTHRDQVPGDAEHRRIDALLKGELRVHKNKHVRPCKSRRLWFFPVDNTAGATADAVVDELREAIEAAVTTDPLRYIDEELPIIWLQTLDSLHEPAAEGQSYPPHRTLREVVELAEECGVDSWESVMAMLRVFHQLGVVLHFDTDELRCVVVVDPQWLVNAVASIIRDPKLHG